MIKQKTIDVCGEPVVIQQLPAQMGMEVFLVFSKIMAGAKEGISVESLLNLEETKIDLGRIIAGIIEATDIKGTPEFIRKLIEDSMVSPAYSQDYFNGTFAGHYDELFSLVATIFKFNNFDDLVKKSLWPIIEQLLPIQSDGTNSTP